MKLRALALILFLIPSITCAKYDCVGNSIRIYESKDYAGAFFEGLMGAMGTFYGSMFYVGTRNFNHNRGRIISTPGSLVSGLFALGGVGLMADAVRRAFASAHVGLEISPIGLMCKDASIVPWHDINSIECVSFTTVQYGRPFVSSYHIQVSTRESIPVEIDGGKLSESMNTILTFVRKFYKGNINMRKEVVQDITPRPNNTHVYNNQNGDSLVALAQLGGAFLNRDI